MTLKFPCHLSPRHSYLSSQGIKLIQGFLNGWVSGYQEQQLSYSQSYPEILRTQIFSHKPVSVPKSFVSDKCKVKSKCTWFPNLNNFLSFKPHKHTLAPLDWQAGKACQTHYIQAPSQHQGGTSPEGRKQNINTNGRNLFLTKPANNKITTSERAAATKLEGSSVLTCTTEQHVGTDPGGATTF